MSQAPEFKPLLKLSAEPATDAEARLERLSKEFDDIKKSLAQLKQISRPDPAMALVRARKILEYVASDLFRRHIREPRGTRPLENLIDRLMKDGIIDLHIKAYMDQVRGLGNAAAHGEAPQEFSEADVIRALDALLVVLDWYFKKEQIGDLSQLDSEVSASESSIMQYRTQVRHARQARDATSRWRHLGGILSVLGLAILLFALDAGAGIGPPWPPALQTFILSLLTMAGGWFAIDRGAQSDLIPRRAPRWLIIYLMTSFISYVVMMALFTIPAPTWPNLESRGLWLQKPIANHLDNSPGVTVEDLLAGAEYNPNAIWVPWTVGLIRGILLSLWLSLATALAAMVDCFLWQFQENRYDSSLPA